MTVRVLAVLVGSTGRDLLTVLLQDREVGLESLPHMANDIQYHLGTPAGESDIDTPYFKIIGMKLCELNIVPTLVVAYLDKNLHDIEWVVPRLPSSAINKDKAREIEIAEELADAIGDRMKPIVESLLRPVKPQLVTSPPIFKNGADNREFEICLRVQNASRIQNKAV